MDVVGFWTGEYRYDGTDTPSVKFQAELTQAGAILSGTSTEQNTFDDAAGQILIASLLGKVSNGSVHFTKTYSNTSKQNSKIIYNGVLTKEGDSITGSWSIHGIWSGSFQMTRALEQKPRMSVIRENENEPV